MSATPRPIPKTTARRIKPCSSTRRCTTRAWRQELGRPEIGPGGFGENFTVDGLDETTACIGDVYAVGDAHIQVTGPRYPCAKISRRWGIPTLTARVAETGRTGWYCRVLQEGWVEPRVPILLVDRPYPTISVARVNDFGHGRNRDIEAARELAACPLLPEWWQRLVVSAGDGQGVVKGARFLWGSATSRKPGTVGRNGRP